MTQPTPQDPRQCCANFQIRLMKAMDKAWADAEAAEDPAARAKALAKAKLCGQFAASARRIAAITPPEPRRPAIKSSDDDAPDQPLLTQAAIARTALERLKAGGGRRGRL